jgi:hypothetical protein
MTIEQTAEAITNWINSCQTSEQLNLCKDVRDKYIKKRFINHVTPLVLATVLNDIDTAIEDRTAVLCTYLKPTGVEVTRNVMPRQMPDELKRFGGPGGEGEEAEEETATATEGEGTEGEGE